MAGRLQGKTCIVTGIAHGIGRAAALRFSEEGAVIVGCDIDERGALAVLDEVRAAGGQMEILAPCDLTNTNMCSALVDLAVSKFGSIDVLYNNAARAYFGWIDEISEEDWAATLNEEINIVFRMTRAAWPHLKKSRGVIVNTASAAAYTTYSVMPGIAHTTAKAGIIAMTRHLAMEGREHGIRANSISPGVIETAQTRPLLEIEAWRECVVGRTLLNRLGQPLEVANVALFLASDEASYVTGADWVVDGGALA